MLRSPCRRRLKIDMLRSVGLPWDEPSGDLRIAEALDAEDLSLVFLRTCVQWHFCGRPRAPDRGELTQASCTANHIYAVHAAAQSGWERILVVEDDIVLPVDFAATMAALVDRLDLHTREAWTVLNFGCPEKWEEATGEKLHGGTGRSPPPPKKPVLGTEPDASGPAWPRPVI